MFIQQQIWDNDLAALILVLLLLIHCLLFPPYCWVFVWLSPCFVMLYCVYFLVLCLSLPYCLVCVLQPCDHLLGKC